MQKSEEPDLQIRELVFAAGYGWRARSARLLE